MTAPTFLTRIDIEPGRILVEVEMIGEGPVVLGDEPAARLRPQLAEALEGALERFWEGRD